MDRERTTEEALSRLIIRLKAGDDAARWELIDRGYDRLRRLAAKILNESYPRIKAAGIYHTTDLTSEAKLRLARALQKVSVNDTKHFFRLAAQNIGWILGEAAKRLDRDRSEAPDAASTNNGVIRRYDCHEAMIKLLEFLDQLPRTLQAVVYYKIWDELQDEGIATELGVSTRAVQRYWLRAREQLGENLRVWLKDRPPQTP